MNRMERPSSGSEARLRYLDGDYQVLRSGAFVTCAVSGLPIALEDLRYWNVARQEPYASARIAMDREIAIQQGRA
jgi:hypothetical protein